MFMSGETGTVMFMVHIRMTSLFKRLRNHSKITWYLIRFWSLFTNNKSLNFNPQKSDKGLHAAPRYLTKDNEFLNPPDYLW